MKNAYSIWYGAGARECWVRKASWAPGKFKARLVAMRPPKGPPPYYGNVGFDYEVWGPDGVVHWEYAITTWGSYAWIEVEPPAGFARIGTK